MIAEILAGPIKIYYADAGTVEPVPPSDSPPSTTWNLIGGSGTTPHAFELYGKDGLTVNMTDERNEVEVMNELYPIEEFITSARQTFEVKLKDMKLATLGLLLGNTPVSEPATATAKGYWRVSTQKVFRPKKYAFLAVGQTPYDALEGEVGLNYWAPNVTFKGPGSFTHMLSTEIDLTLMINCLIHPTLGLGYVTANYAPITP